MVEKNPCLTFFETFNFNCIFFCSFRDFTFCHISSKNIQYSNFLRGTHRAACGILVP